MKRFRTIMIGLLIVIASGWHGIAGAARLKDIAEINGVRMNQLVGYGLVVGLDGSGDGKKATFTIQSLASMLEKMGVTVDQKDIKVKNVAAVMVTAKLPPFAKRGNRIDVLVSSIGDANNLQGGTLMLTPLKGVDGKIYALAQGPVNTGGFGAGGTASTVVKNFPTVGRVLSGAIIEREVPNDFSNSDSLQFSLHNPDVNTVVRVVDVINAQFAEPVAHAQDAGTIEIAIPERYMGNVIPLLASLSTLEVEPDNDAKVVINERTGTVVMGEQVRISTIAIAHGNLSIVIKENVNVSQPLPFSEGQTVASPNTQVNVQEDNNQLVVVPNGVSIGDVVNALNALGVSPRDLIAIFQAIKAAGALQADLEVI
jgi:flagellar P-ring protein precursor FlgI